MTDAPPTVEEAKAELAEIDAWLQEFNQRQQQAQNHLLRAAFLNGVIAASTR